ncbi:uncharacterized protein [Montipora foliosa]|uniref:uncharacterized protein n=1 Tax=Montipora foliosa TaxID=591990 RepID=UPI0035F1D46B
MLKKKHLETIQSKLTNNVTSKKKQEIWEEITRAVNAVGTANRKVSEVKDKWKNLHSTAKKEFSEFKRETKKTGGAQPPKLPSVSSLEKELKCLKTEDRPGFSSLNGFETATLPIESATVSSELLSNIDRSLDENIED